MISRGSTNWFSTAILSAVSIIAISFSANISEAKRGTRVTEKKTRLVTLMESASGEGLAKYQSAGGNYKFVFAAEGFTAGDNIDIYVNDLKVSSMLMEFDPVAAAVAGELVLTGATGDTSGWAAGLPLNLQVGARIRMENTSNGEIMEGSLDIL